MNISARSILQIPDGTQVRYIKLGEGGDWEKECIEKDIIRIGFGSEIKFQFCVEGQWDRVENSYIEDGKSKGTATRFTNETRLFFEDRGSILWITFVGERLYWSFLESDKPQRHVDGHGTWRKVKGGWQCKDINGDDLTKDKLSGALTKLAAYRGTS